ncbi:MAG: hypothetical protein P8Y21_01410 [Gemmatimonadales bacterium]
MKSDRLLVLACAVGLLAGACSDDPGGRSGVPTEPSFKPDKPETTACDLVSGAVGDVFQGQAKNNFDDLLGLDDGTISATDLAKGWSAISVAFNGRATDDPLSEYQLNPTYQSWAGTLNRSTTFATGALLTRLITECAATDGTDGSDPFTTNADGTNIPAFDWDGFEEEMALALDQTGGPSLTVGYGAVAVRNDPDEGAVALPDYTNGPYWYAMPDPRANPDPSDWDDVFGPTTLIYAYGTERYDKNEEPIGGSAEFKNLPRVVVAFENDEDVLMVTCQVVDPGVGQTGPRIQRAGNVLTSYSGDTLCTDGIATSGTSILSRLARAVGGIFTPPALHADAAVAVGGGFGGFGSKWSPFDISNITGVRLVFDNQPCKKQLESTADGSATHELDFEPCNANTEELRIIAETVNGSRIEDIETGIFTVDNNGQLKGLGTIQDVGGVETCVLSDNITATTQNDASGSAGVAVFSEPLCIIGRGGFRLRVSATDFPSADSDGFQVGPDN